MKKQRNGARSSSSQAQSRIDLAKMTSGRCRGGSSDRRTIGVLPVRDRDKPALPGWSDDPSLFDGKVRRFLRPRRQSLSPGRRGSSCPAFGSCGVERRRSYTETTERGRSGATGAGPRRRTTEGTEGMRGPVPQFRSSSPPPWLSVALRGEHFSTCHSAASRRDSGGAATAGEWSRPNSGRRLLPSNLR